MASSVQNLPEGWSEHSLNGEVFYFHAASNTSQQTVPLPAEHDMPASQTPPPPEQPAMPPAQPEPLPHRRVGVTPDHALRLSAAEHRAQAAAAARTSMDDWRQQRRTGQVCTGALAPVATAPAQLRSQDFPSEQAARMPQALHAQALQSQPLPQQPDISAAQAQQSPRTLADSSLAGTASGVMVVADTPQESRDAEVDSPSTCSKKVALCLCCISVFLFLVAAILVVSHHGHLHFPCLGPHHHLPHHMHFLHLWHHLHALHAAIGCILLVAAACVFVILSRKNASQRTQVREVSNPAQQSICWKRVGIVVAILLSMLLIKGVAHVAYGRFHRSWHTHGAPSHAHHQHRWWHEVDTNEAWMSDAEQSAWKHGGHVDWSDASTSHGKRSWTVGKGSWGRSESREAMDKVSAIGAQRHRVSITHEEAAKTLDMWTTLSGKSYWTPDSSRVDAGEISRRKHESMTEAREQEDMSKKKAERARYIMV